jgi:hypothetical protein
MLIMKIIEEHEGQNTANGKTPLVLVLNPR